MKRVFVAEKGNRSPFEKYCNMLVDAVTSTEEQLRDEVELVNYYYDKSQPNNANELWNFSKTIESLSQADVAYFPKGWESSNEARIQHMLAEEYGITILEE